MRQQPCGLGYFLASQDMVSEADTVRRLHAGGARWAAPLCESVDGKKWSETRVARMCRALRDDGIDPWPYSFPPPGETGPANAHMRACLAAAGITTPPIWDVEPHKGRTWTEGEITALFELSADLNPLLTLYWTDEWADVDWSRAAPEATLIFQLYYSLSSPKTLARKLAHFRDRVVIPAAGSYVGDEARLLSDLHGAEPLMPSARALAIWCLRSTDHGEPAILKAWGSRVFPQG